MLQGQSVRIIEVYIPGHDADWLALYEIGAARNGWRTLE